MSLRSLMMWAAAVAAALVFIASTALVLVTSYLHQTAVEMRSATESVRIAEELRVDLLLLDRALDPLHRAELKSELRALLSEAREHARTEPQLQLLDAATPAVVAYIGARNAAWREGAPAEQIPALTQSELREAFAALEALKFEIIASARVAEEKAGRVDRLSNVMGTVVALTLLVGTAALVVWLRLSAFRPIARLDDAMREFAEHNRKARAAETGLLELRLIAARFNGMADALERQSEIQLTFLASVAHDLRTPLSALRLAAGSVREGAPLPAEERVRRVFKVFGRQVDRLERMVGDFLDAARIEAGQLDLRLEARDLRALAEETVDLFETTSRSHEVTLSAPPDPVMIRADATRITQALNNLISNAIKYSPAGGQVAVEVLRSGAEATVTVADQGIGLTEEDRRSLFEPFRRVGASRDAVAGVGLGLFAARRILEAHGGSVEVESQPGSGSVFRLRLPLMS
jgi:two-component system, OmpR family, sensor histidine kinase MtrB